MVVVTSSARARARERPGTISQRPTDEIDIPSKQVQLYVGDCYEHRISANRLGPEGTINGYVRLHHGDNEVMYCRFLLCT